ncbi:peptidase, partial [bacterium]|nr:peptidase [bacterium]
RQEMQVQRNGINYVLARMESYLTDKGAYEEVTSGVDYYNFVTELTKNYETQKAEIIANLQDVAKLIFNKDNLIVAVTCDAEDYQTFAVKLGDFTGSLKTEKPARIAWDFDLTAKNEGLLTTSKVQYVCKGYDYKKLGYEFNGKFNVMNQILSREYLQNTIRVIGGAYGGFSGFTQNGFMYFASYRDPNLVESLENYNKAPEYLKTFEADDDAMTRFIIGTISRLDKPLTASQKGARAVARYFSKTRLVDVQQRRTEVLNTTAADIQQFSKMVSDIVSHNVICVYGNESKLKENAAVFKTLVPLVK